ncbi:MAG: hypothetical protein ACLP05_10810, partial [Candidatus Kryptoniota bacterium]
MKKIALLSLVFVGVLFLSLSTIQAQDTTMKAQAGLKVVELKLGTGVQDKQIVGEDSTFALNGKAYLWMKVTGASAGDSVVVTWKHADKEYKTTLGIGANSWHTWAYKTM